ncbi:MAG: hypothetical protein LBK66_00810, partial [Spirochaetaceae bacterium]|nr:hypothetical protein [Spirochaetaceae bacterium]
MKVQQDRTEKTVQRGGTERTVQQGGTDRTVQQDETARTVQQDETARTVQRNREILPLDDYLQISGLPFKMSPEMMAETAFFGVHESSFASAEKMMRKYLPTRISDSLIRKVTEYVGRKTFEEDTRRACPIERNLDKIPDKPDKKGILYIMVDGATVNTRLKDEQGSSWRENKLGLVFSSTDLRKRKDGVTHDILKKEYMPCLGSAGNFKKYLLECAVRNGYGRYEQT